MPITIRGGTPLAVVATGNPVTGTLNGTRQPQDGDLLLILHVNDFYSLSNMPNAPTVNGSATGVTEITGTGVPVDGGTNVGHIRAYRYEVTATGDVALSVTETGSADEDKGLIAYVLSGVNLTDPVDDLIGAFSAVSENAHQLPALAPDQASGLLICHVNTTGGGSCDHYEPPTGMVEAYDTKTAFMTVTGATQTLTAAGSTGTRTFLPQNSDNTPANLGWVGLALVIRSAEALVTERTVSDSVGLTDAVATVLDADRAATDGAGLTDMVTVAVSRALTIDDSVGITDTAAPGHLIEVTVTDLVGLVDSTTAPLRPAAARGQVRLLSRGQVVLR